MPERDLEEVFEAWWPRLEVELTKVSTQKMPTPAPHRDQREILEELVDLVREQSRRTPAVSGALREGQVYVMKNGILQLVRQFWIMQNGVWAEAKVIPPNLGLGVGLRADLAGPIRGGLLDVSESERSPGDLDDHSTMRSG